MAKVKVVVTHEESGEIELGDIPAGLLGEYLKGDDRNWSLSDINADWKVVSVKVGDKEV